MSIICFVHIKGAIFYVYRRHKNAYNASELYIFSTRLTMTQYSGLAFNLDNSMEHRV